MLPSGASLTRLVHYPLASAISDWQNHSRPIMGWNSTETRIGPSSLVVPFWVHYSELPDISSISIRLLILLFLNHPEGSIHCHPLSYGPILRLAKAMHHHTCRYPDHEMYYHSDPRAAYTA